jgi:hypothetical protein
LEKQIEERLRQAGWGKRVCAVVIHPELESWVWFDSDLVDRLLGWGNTIPDLRSWLRQEGFLAQGAYKPANPKEAVEAALRRSGKKRSSAIYLALAEGAENLDRCVDPSFGKLLTVLRGWFAQNRPQ